MAEEIKTRSGINLLADRRETNGGIEISLRMKNGRECVLHWGLAPDERAPWQTPPQPLWPKGSRAFGEGALQTPFTLHNNEGRIIIRLNKDLNFHILNFALFFPEEGSWDNNRGKNYRIRIKPPARKGPPPAQVLEEELKGREVLFKDVYGLDPDHRLAVALSREDGRYRLNLLTDMAGPLLLHWGVAIHGRNEWLLPPSSMHPPKTEVFDGKAAETPFVLHEGLNQLILEFGEEDAPMGIPFVLRHPGTGRWIKNQGRNFYIPVAGQKEIPLSQLAETIIRAEMGNHSWTLMHRFNLCHDLIENVRNDVEGLALLFVWLRFSAIRQLVWQRNYNTKPRELTHSQDRLTLKLAEVYISEPASRDLIRLMMTTVGRGGEGQRIRDEILHIMHRHHIKEVAGHFLEEWHQKLHNNATPDDIVICEAYLNFLRSDGDLELFYRTLEAGGVTKERLEGFERPIKSPPDFIPHLKEALIHDFEEYLRLLRSVHSGTDLESAINAARYLLDTEASELLEFIWTHKDNSKTEVVELVDRITRVRRILNRLLNTEKDNVRVRDILYLDLALEEFLRVIVERNIHSRMAVKELVELVGLVLENVRFFFDNEEFSACLREWQRLEAAAPLTRDRALHAKALLDRIGRAIGAFIDHYYQLLQPRAELLGKAFQADSWAITLFSEEIVRGRPAFVLSMLLRYLDPVLRKKAKLGNWQVISQGEGVGRVETVESLSAVQGKSFDRPTVIIADKVRGDEEPPEGVTAVITPDAVDLVSHVAVRARNARLLFAICYDRKHLERLKSLRDRYLSFAVNASGDVVFEEVSGEMVTAPPRVKLGFIKIARPEFTAYAIAATDFREGLVGGKSLNLTRLQGKLPDWIHLPASVALPFGVFENVLALDRNSGIEQRYRELISRLDGNPEEILAEIRKTLLGLEAPEELPAVLRRVMEDAGLAWPKDWDNAWMCIKRVWASRWNERAYLSRKARGIPDEDLFMAVLIQQVVEAEYSFVIHTENPFTGDRDELYAEVVLGLGETLVGNYPGRALGFTCKKGGSEPQLLSYPSKSIGLFGGGLIFRSDSNGEDLSGYAGAGLYDSVMLPPPREVSLDYTEEPLVWDEKFRKELLTGIANVGIMTEKVLGSPQDIEGALVQGRYYVVQTRPQV
ncbi:Phosphoenolpyruvate synthase [hydrothermal vent metagenome]|uniref:Phosphoenolpyruvate synthase n=1 Tax=hydrothermal vent metagenome TaxID=652676 RepID=A0A3B1D4M8_9ZZZZ